jgi:hypothetical protein
VLGRPTPAPRRSQAEVALIGVRVRGSVLILGKREKAKAREVFSQVRAQKAASLEGYRTAARRMFIVAGTRGT